MHAIGPGTTLNSPTSDSSPKTRYVRIETEAQALLGTTEATIKPLFVLRGLSLLATLVALVGLMVTGKWLVGLIMVLCVAAFLWIAIRHEQLERVRRVAWVTARHARWSLAALDRRWNDLPLRSIDIPAEQSAYCKDLDLFGRGSLFQWLDTVETPRGIELLKQWLLSPASPEEIRIRQEAVAELSASPEYGEELRIRAESLMSSRRDGTGLDKFVAWSESSGGVSSRTWMVWFARSTTAIVLLLSTLLVVGFIDKTIGGSLLVAFILLNMLFSIMFVGAVHDLFNSIAARQYEAMAFQRLFQWASESPRQARRLQDIHQRLAEGESPAIRAISELGWLTAAANLRRGGLFSILYLMLQFAFLWDFHWLAQIERWRLRHGKHVRDWFDAVGELEALCALAKAAYAESDWVFPVITSDDSPIQIAGEELGHPLLSSQRVCNSVSLGPLGKLLLVTGSNMSGKSTLLRAIGTNVVLAQAGGKVCARSLRLPMVELATSMRVADSLAEGVSFYMAELKRLKQIVDQAALAQQGKRPRVCFLLDEILQGTNSRERHIAVTRVIAHLLENGAIGAVSTHDLELAVAPDLQGKIDCVHFRESFSQEPDGTNRMTFDYIMRPGVATTTNALKLLEIVGLGNAKA